MFEGGKMPEEKIMNRNEAQKTPENEMLPKESWREKVKKTFYNLDRGERICVAIVPILSLIFYLICLCSWFLGGSFDIISFVLQSKEDLFMTAILIASVIGFLRFFDPDYKNSLLEELEGKRSEILILGAVGSLGLALIQQNDISSLIGIDNLAKIIIVVLYLLLLIAIIYRRLTTAVHRKRPKEITVIVKFDNNVETNLSQEKVDKEFKESIPQLHSNVSNEIPTNLLQTTARTKKRAKKRRK